MGGDSGVECRGDCAVEHGNGLGQESIVEDVLRKLRMEFCSSRSSGQDPL